MEADSIGGDSFLYDFLPDIPEMNSDLIDDMYESTIEHPEPKDESDLEINYQENTGIQNILLSNDSPVQYHNLYLEEDVPLYTVAVSVKFQIQANLPRVLQLIVQESSIILRITSESNTHLAIQMIVIR